MERLPKLYLIRLSSMDSSGAVRSTEGRADRPDEAIVTE